MPETLTKPVLTAEDVMADPKLQVAYLAEMGRQSFPYFCRELLGYTDMIRRKDALVPGYSHDELCEFLTDDPAQFKLILWPRHTFKSYIATIGYTLWRLATNPNLRFLVVCDTNEKAEGFLLGMKNHLEGKIAGSLFRTVYGDWTVDPKRGVYNQQAMVVRVRTKAQVEPSVDTAGIETSKTGKHYDVIVFDDLVSEKNITTPELMQKVKDVRKKYLSILKPGGQIIMPGTRWHYGDAYGEIVAQEEEHVKQGRPKVFATCVRSAEVVVGDQTIYPFSRMGEHSLTKERLALLQSEQGTYVFSCLYLNSPTDDATAFFKLGNFAWYTPDTLPTGLYITAALDPIPPSDQTKGDDAALTIVGHDTERNMYVRDIVAGRLQPSEQIDALFALHQRWGIRALAVETNHWQKTLLKDIEVRVAQERKVNPNFRLFHVEPITRGSANSKHQDIRGLQPYHERRAIRLPGTRYELLMGVWQKLAMQMTQYPNAPHDDVLDSLSMHLHVQQAGTATPIVQTLPYTSAAWFEREQQKEEMVVMARRPRWQRRPLPELAFS